MSSVRLTDTWRTTTFRLVLLYGAMFAVGIVALLALIYHHTTTYINQQTDQLLKAELQSCLITPVGELPDLLAGNIRRDARHLEVFGLFGVDGRMLAGNVTRIPAELLLDSAPRSVAVNPGDINGGTTPSIRALATRLPNGELLLVGREEKQTREIRNVILQALEDAVLIIALGTAWGVWLSIARIRRIQGIQKASQEIINGELAVRLPIAGRADELDMLAQIVNRMLDEIEQRMRDIKGASDSIAHNLRTPLTRLHATLNRLLQTTRGTDTYSLTERAVEETDVLLARFRALLRIAEISGSMRRAAFEKLDLRPIVQDLQDIFAPVAEEKDIGLGFSLSDQPLEVWGDRALLFEAILNLIDNAIKFTPPNGHVEVHMTRSSTGTGITVRDDGPGIPAEELNLVMQPFYRSNASGSSPGYGVGLSVVGAIVSLHGFRFELSSSAAGTSATIEISG